MLKYKHLLVFGKNLLRKLLFFIDYYLTKNGRDYRAALAEFSRIGSEKGVPVLKEVRLYDNVPGQGLPYYAWEVYFATKVIHKEQIRKLVDVGSYVTWHPVVSAICELEVVDVRQVECPAGMFTSKQGDMGRLPYDDGSIEALSSLCVIEHIGLGRYGDPLGYDLDKEATKELARIISPSGHLIISTLLGKQALLFNAGRIYDLKSFIAMFPEFEIRDQLIFCSKTMKIISEEEAYRRPLGFAATFVCLHLQKKA